MAMFTHLTRMRMILAAVILLSLAVVFAIKSSRIFNTFDKDTIIRSSFETDLTPYIAKEKTTYTDGCLQFHGISKSHPLFLLYFSEPYEKTFHITFPHREFDDAHAQDTICFRRIGKSFDGYVPVVAYVPEEKILIFGCSNGIGG
jgi:hypothetical protein